MYLHHFFSNTCQVQISKYHSQEYNIPQSLNTVWRPRHILQPKEINTFISYKYIQVKILKYSYRIQKPTQNPDTHAASSGRHGCYRTPFLGGQVKHFSSI